MANVKIENLFKNYKVGTQSVKALQGVYLSIDQGSFMSVVGPSGSGKTTLLNIIGCLDKPTEGKVIFGEKDIVPLNDNQLTLFRNHNIGFIFQDFNLIPVLTVYENVEFALAINPFIKKKHKILIMQMLEMVGIAELKKRFPSELSGGQKQRVAIARALVKKPSLVLADEPTANLDSENARNIMEIMHKMNKDLQTSFLFSTHDKLVMNYAEKIVHLRDGKIDGGDRV
ncbi:MAG: lipoprotein-releasing system ATP-binding protein LolD [bacterium (Candidatus Stahlbacteria) CG23_combo_of_CG06-09_8_20_14_all_34_7]|nr:MAG: lipoprotein-releasing system ATP-binding protein LolD [bacterium (Candidatus Stahlbacteria) CG23_combo_of_CG06-09_8_20_14_all_34_7]